ncbi:MAG: hypothetical protein ACREJB_07415, partial [Planctomycetaceae bacterium]
MTTDTTSDGRVIAGGKPAAGPEHLRPTLATRVTALVGLPASRRLARGKLLLPLIAARDVELRPLSDAALRTQSLSLRHRARCGEAPRSLAVEAFALVREAAGRTIGLRHFDVQLLGGLALLEGAIAEIETGEGKTLVATLPLYLRALAGRGAHLATVNDYLARRDAEWMGPVYRLLGLTVGVIQAGMSATERRSAYGCDITYGTAKEFGFDFLRDRLRTAAIMEFGERQGLFGRMKDEGRMKQSSTVAHPSSFSLHPSGNVQREPHFLLVDEADSILIDEARTPLVISAASAEDARLIACYRWSAEAVGRFEPDRHYQRDSETRSVQLTPAGRELARSLARPPELDGAGM